ncbi:hypothetical protein T492DRAFT_844649 [Pavlovales sp. CCMP2436]|nr:hypothetical protein T492DRAFT_844649 [Pavlovales sp. CCMP2436]
MTVSSFVGQSALGLAPLGLSPRTPPQQAQAPATAQLALLVCFTKWFLGSFDNAAQAADDAAGGLAPREGGGHEHIRWRIPHNVGLQRHERTTRGVLYHFKLRLT